MTVYILQIYFGNRRIGRCFMYHGFRANDEASFGLKTRRECRGDLNNSDYWGQLVNSEKIEELLLE